MIKGLREKFRKNEKGFTLIEMLIVVAIIAILIAVSIPLVNSALERAREATDAANERSFKAELLVCYTTKEIASGTAFDSAKAYAYNAGEGKLVEPDASLKAYGQGTTTGKDTEEKTSKILYGTVTADGTVYMEWAAPAATHAVLTADGTLTSKKLMES